MFSETIPFESYYNEEVYMIADVEAGILYNRSGRRMLALTNDFLIGLHRAIDKECGEKSGDVLVHCGKRWGKNFANGLDGEWTQFYGAPTKEFPLAMFHSLLIQEFGHNGWGLLELDYSNINMGIISVSLAGAIMAEIMPEESSEPADLLTAGIFAGIFSHFISRDLDCIQSQCARRGEPQSRFVIASPSRIATVKRSAKIDMQHSAIISLLLESRD
jgi:predicted hydrocarbon binding protein